jgi:hypothetical protein
MSLAYAPSASRTVIVWSTVALLCFLALAPGKVRARAIDSRDLLASELDRTDAILERVQESVRETSNPRMHDLFSKASTMQKMARRLFETQGDQVDASSKIRVLELTRRARDLALIIQREVRKGVTYQEQARRLLQRSHALLDRIDEHADQIKDRRVQAVLDKARRQLAVAEQQYADGNFEAALRLADSTHALLRNLADTLQREISAERVRRALDHTDALLHRAGERFGGPQGREAPALRQARRLQRRARGAHAAGHELQALKLTREAGRLLADLLGESSGAIDESDVRSAFQRFDARLDRLRDRNGSDIAGPAGRLVDQALQARARAKEAQRSGDDSSALTQLRVGLDLLNRAARILGSDSE